MPAKYFRSLTGKHRRATANRQLGFSLAFVAGATNAGGFLAVKQYKSHISGIVTDLGIELSKLFYWNRSALVADAHAVIANRAKLRIHGTMLASFFVGGLIGAIGFKHVGYVSTVPLAGALVTLAIVPVVDDVLTWFYRFDRRQ